MIIAIFYYRIAWEGEEEEEGAEVQREVAAVASTATPTSTT